MCQSLSAKGTGRIAYYRITKSWMDLYRTRGPEAEDEDKRWLEGVTLLGYVWCLLVVRG